MKITRTINGKTIEIELTIAELVAAYHEQETRNVYNIVRFNMKPYLNRSERKQLIDNKDFIKDVAGYVQDHRDAMYMSIDDMLRYGIEKYKGDYLQWTQAEKSNQN